MTDRLESRSDYDLDRNGLEAGLRPVTSSSVDWAPVDDGISVRGLETGSVLSVYTRNNHYRITVLNGTESAVVVQGGSHFPEPTHAWLQGARGIGCAVKIGWVCIGLRLEFADGPRHVVTSAVRSIALEEVPAIQREFWRLS